MPRLWRSLLCQRVITDKETNLATYVDAVEAFATPRLPYPFPPLFVATVWQRQSEFDKLKARIRLLGPSGNELFTFGFPDLEIRTHAHRHNVQLGGFSIEQVGEHQILIEHDLGSGWIQAAVLPVDIQLMDGMPLPA